MDPTKLRQAHLSQVAKIAQIQGELTTAITWAKVPNGVRDILRRIREDKLNNMLQFHYTMIELLALEEVEPDE